MNFTPRSRASRAGAQPLQLTSMIDVIFLLLIYFILTSTYQAPESQISPALRAESSASGRTELSPQIIEVANFEGVPGFRLGSNVLRGRRELVEVLSRLPRQQGVMVRASGEVSAQWATAALRAARDAGFTRITYVPAR